MSSDYNQQDQGSPFPYLISGVVVNGFGRGSRKLGCPTANIEQSVVDSVKLDNGIYYGFAQLRPGPTAAGATITDKFGPVYSMVCSLGFNPQFNNERRSLECYLLEQFAEDFYGSQLKVALCGRLRNEKRFESLDELKEAINRDIETTRDLLDVQRKFEAVRNDSFFKCDEIKS